MKSPGATEGRFILLTGCSGGGKSTLLASLGERGFATVPEPGRRIVVEELACGGAALPWVDPLAFAQHAVRMATSDLETARHSAGPVFFDRGLIDAAVALEHAGGRLARETLGRRRPYAEPVFILPPWEEMFQEDSERRHDFGAAMLEYHRIRYALDDLDYQVKEVPRAPIDVRTDAVLAACGLG